MSSDIRIDGGLQLAQVARQLSAVDKGMAKMLRTAVRDVAKPIAEDVRTAAGRYSAAVAKTITVTVAPAAKGGAKVSISAKGNKMPPGHQALPALLEGFAGNPFTHPVFGGTGVAKQAAHPYLTSTIEPKLDKALADIATIVGNAIDDAFKTTGLR